MNYQVQRTGVELIDRNLDLIASALAQLASAIRPTTILTFLTLGNNGGGYVSLVPPKAPDGTTSLYRAQVGSVLVAAVDLTTLASLQTSFEQVLTANDQIKQLSASNLSADKILFLIQQG